MSLFKPQIVPWVEKWFVTSSERGSKNSLQGLCWLYDICRQETSEIDIEACVAVFGSNVFLEYPDSGYLHRDKRAVLDRVGVSSEGILAEEDAFFVQLKLRSLLFGFMQGYAFEQKLKAKSDSNSWTEDEMERVSMAVATALPMEVGADEIDEFFRISGLINLERKRRFNRKKHINARIDRVMSDVADEISTRFPIIDGQIRQEYFVSLVPRFLDEVRGGFISNVLELYQACSLFDLWSVSPDSKYRPPHVQEYFD